MAASTAGSKSKKIAVIAVHGVADQQPAETARAAAEMLLRRGRRGVSPPSNILSVEDDVASSRAWPLGDELQEDATYSVDCECAITIPVEPVRCERIEARARSLMNQKPACLEEYMEGGQLREIGAAAATGGGTLSGDPDEVFNHHEMREQLQDYAPKGADAHFRSIRIGLERRRNDRVESRVDVYEMYWADLSRLGGKVLGIFLDFYGLLFSLCRLGGASLDRAVGHLRHSRTWRWSAALHHIAEALLVLVIPILNLTVLGMVSVLIARWAERTEKVTPLVWAINYWPAVLAGVLLAYGLYRKRYSGAAGKWPLKLGWPLLIAAALVGVQVRWGFFTVAGFAFFLWLVAAYFLRKLFLDWDRRRAGALFIGMICVGGMTLLLGWQLFFGQTGVKASSVQETFNASVRASVLVLGRPPAGTATAAEIQGLKEPEQAQERRDALATCRSVLEQIETGRGRVGLLGAVWGLFFLLLIVSTVLAALALRRGTPDAKKRTVKRAAWTAHLTLVLPGFVVLVVNIALWQALTWLASRDTFGTILLGPADHCVVQVLADDAVLPSLHTAIAIGSAAILALLWFILPAALSETELKASRDSHDPSRVSWLGNALKVAFPWMRGSGEIIRLVMVGLLPLAIVVDVVVMQSSPEWAQAGWAQWLLERKTTFIAWIGVGIFVVVTGSRGPFRGLALGFRAALDIALDVANWLRLDPREATPRARICARYVSLLRYIALRGYDGVVIVAHSQGTVITADLLRFLRREGWSADPVLKRLLAPGTPIHLFTVGSPLRQLYGRRFPYRYGWARAQSGTRKPGPRVEDLGIATWSNAYRSGDYVGRNLWPRKDPWAMRWVDPDDPHNPAKPKPDSRHREKCIGLGGHIHYLDGTAPEVGAEMDRLIASI